MHTELPKAPGSHPEEASSDQDSLPSLSMANTELLALALLEVTSYRLPMPLE